MIANATAMMVVEMQSRFQLGDVMDALWIELGQTNMSHEHFEGHILSPQVYSRTPLVHEISPTLLDATAHDR